MYPHFIEIHHKGRPITINIDTITHIWEQNVTTRVINLVTGYCDADESYDDIKNMIRSAGCAIQKQDPRLDTSVPLSMDELCVLSMVGQPVWNSNRLEWMLVADSELGDVNRWVDLVDACGKIHRLEPHDVQSTPLYRMKVQK